MEGEIVYIRGLVLPPFCFLSFSPYTVICLYYSNKYLEHLHPHLYAHPHCDGQVQNEGRTQGTHGGVQMWTQRWERTYTGGNTMDGQDVAWDMTFHDFGIGM
jgi:hypothetical protein